MADWDRTHDWELQRVHATAGKVFVRFAGDGPSLAELAALRRMWPQFRDVPVAQLRATIGDSRLLEVAETGGIDRCSLPASLRAEGLAIEYQDRSTVDCIPFDRTESRRLKIDDADERRRVVEEMIAAGVPVRDIEVD